MDDEVILAAKTVCAHDFIMQMEDGYYTQVNERGSRLSPGQRQLISFARALLADPKILILDEATSSIDTETEIILQKGLNELLKGLRHPSSSPTVFPPSRTVRASCMWIKARFRKAEAMKNCCERGPYYNLFMSQYSFMKDKASKISELLKHFLMDGAVNAPACGTVTIKVHYLRADRFAFGREKMAPAKVPFTFGQAVFFMLLSFVQAVFVCLSCLM